MNISVFDVIGPVMIGPSSSHTAGAARLSKVARNIVAKPFSHVSFGLHGSFAKTYKGHGTDCALVAGILGFDEDDERLADAFSIAKERGITFEFYEIDIEGMHENTVMMTFFLDDNSKCVVTGSSIGGAQIIIRKINYFEVEFTAQSSTLIIQQLDRKGVISEVSKKLAQHNINIGIMKLSRTAKGEKALWIIETDDNISNDLVNEIQNINNILSVKAINVESSEDKNV